MCIYALSLSLSLCLSLSLSHTHTHTDFCVQNTWAHKYTWRAGSTQREAWSPYGQPKSTETVLTKGRVTHYSVEDPEPRVQRQVWELPSCSSYLSHWCNKIPYKSNLRKKWVNLAYSSGDTVYSSGDGTGREAEATGHTMSRVRKPGWTLEFVFSFLLSPGPQTMGWCHLHLGWVFPPQ